MTDLTIREIRTTLLQLPWADIPGCSAMRWARSGTLSSWRPSPPPASPARATASAEPAVQRTIGACIAEALAPRVVGRSATEVEGIWQDLWRATLTGGRGGVTMMAQSAIESRYGTCSARPPASHRLWGHARGRIPAYGSGCFPARWARAGGQGQAFRRPGL